VRTPLFRSTIVIWSDFEPAWDKLSDLARDAETGGSYCSSMQTVQVDDPPADPAWDGTEFFGTEDTCSGCGSAYDPGADHCRFCENDDDTAPCVCGYQAEAAQGETGAPDPPHPTPPVEGRRQQ
jgi:hypothetical protein